MKYRTVKEYNFKNYFRSSDIFELFVQFSKKY